ncbi:MAG: nucleotidyltransferase domain-containing protein [Candidatus Woesearchaeota archaeon]
MIKKLSKVNPLETNEAYQKVLAWFFSFPTIKVGLSDLAKKVNISKTTANLVINRLVKEGFLIKDVIGKTWQIYCNQKHKYNFSKKISYNLSLIYKSDIINSIKETIPNFKVIILFGSYRKGDDIETSDIDIAVEIPGNENLKIVELGQFPLLGLRKNVTLNLHVFSRNKIDINFFNNIANGIVLDGFLEVRL